MALVGATLLLAACGPGDGPDGSNGSEAIVDRSAVVARIATHCTDLESPDLGAGTLCVDNGFRLRNDDFSFANWGRSAEADSNVSLQTLIDMFGPGTVCMPSSGPDECTPRPATQQILYEWNTALSGGRCEGMAALATRFRMGFDLPADFASDATTVAELSRSDGRLDSWIAYWWSTQFVREVADRAEETRASSPVELLEQLVQGLANDVGYTLGLYHGAGGHTVVPFAVTRRGTTFVVHVYDNNHPRERREIVVDPDTDRWTYVDALPGEDWSGGTGSFELTPMSSREGPFTCPYCTVPKDGSPTVVTVASRDAAAPGYVLLRSGSGEIESSPDGISNAIDGAVATPAKGAGASITIKVPASVGAFSVAVRRARPTVPAGDVVVTVRRPGHFAVQVAGNLADLVVGDRTDDAVLRVRPDDTTVSAPERAVARVSVATDADIVRRRLRAGEVLVVDRPGPRTVDIALKGGAIDGVERVSVPLRGGSNSTEIELVDDAGSLVLTDAVVSPVTVRRPATINHVRRTRPTTTTVADTIVISDPG